MIECEECGKEIGTDEEIMDDRVEAHRVERNNTAEILCETCYHKQPHGSLREDEDDAPLLLEEVKRLRKVMSKIGCSLCDECGLSIEEHIRYHTENDVIAGCPFGEDEE